MKDILPVMKSTLRVSMILFAFVLAAQSNALAQQESEQQAEVQTQANACEEFTEERAQEWDRLQPKNPGYFRLGRAWLVYRDEAPKLRAYRSDKVAHCYMGCRVAQLVDAETAVYLGWLKEKRDLNDCNPKTKFDPKDEAATRRGSEIASNPPDELIGTSIACDLPCKYEFESKPKQKSKQQKKRK